MGEWVSSDNNMITVVANPRTASTVENRTLRIVARWPRFEQEIVSRAADLPGELSLSSLNQHVSTLRRIVNGVCELALFRRLRRIPQDARHHVIMLPNELIVVEVMRTSAGYKNRILKAKENSWRRFVGENSHDT